MDSNIIAPNHIGFIMDGNGRWAKKLGKPRNYGHQKGADKVEEVVTWCFERGVKYVSLYAFSCENWGRPKEEVVKILSLLTKFLKKYTKTLIKNKIRLVVSGDVNALSEDIVASIKNSEEITSHFKEKTLNIAINYGGRQEIVGAVNSLISKGEKVTVDTLSNELSNRGIPDLDLVVRTSGEIRVSNFYLWQIAYAELYFTDVLWPDFSEEELEKALIWFSNRNRRFGKL